MIWAFDINGEVHIYRAVPKEHLEQILGPMTDKEYKSFVTKRTVDEVRKAHGDVPFKVIEESEIPKDRTFRDAWDYDLKVNMDKARAIHMEEIRKRRKVALEKLDIETMKGNDVQAQKQKLRDLPKTFDLSKAATPEELKALWPEELK